METTDTDHILNQGDRDEKSLETNSLPQEDNRRII